METLKFTLLNKLLLILSLFVNVTIIHAESYRVVTQSTLNVRSAPTKDSKKIYSLSNGCVVDVIQKESNGWMKIEVDGLTGYVNGSYLEAVLNPSNSDEKPVRSSWFKSFSYHWWESSFILFIIFSISFLVLTNKYPLIAMLLNLAAAGRCLDFNGIFDFLDFNQNGVFLFLFYLILIYLFLSFLIYLFFSSLFSVLDLFKRPLVAIVALLASIFYFFGMLNIVLEFFTEHFLLCLIILFSSISSGAVFLGTFKDKDGTVWEVYKR